MNSFEGPVFASLAIDASPKIGGCLIAGWNVCSLILEIYLMRKIYFLIPALQEPRERKKSEKPFRGIRDWASSWKLWLKSPVFWPGLALAVLYTNIFQLSFWLRDMHPLIVLMRNLLLLFGLLREFVAFQVC